MFWLLIRIEFYNMYKEAMKNKKYHVIVRYYFKRGSGRHEHALTSPLKNNSSDLINFHFSGQHLTNDYVIPPCNHSS